MSIKTGVIFYSKGIVIDNDTILYGQKKIKIY
jgi:hypothetical protein